MLQLNTNYEVKVFLSDEGAEIEQLSAPNAPTVYCVIVYMPTPVPFMGRMTIQMLRNRVPLENCNSVADAMARFKEVNESVHKQLQDQLTKPRIETANSVPELKLVQ